MESIGRVLFLFTNRFPYGNDSPFLIDEIKTLSKRFEKIIICPYFPDNDMRHTLPANVEVVYLFKKWRFKSWKVVVKYFLQFISVLLYEYRHSAEKKIFSRRFSYSKSLLLQILSKASYLQRFINQFPSKNICFYTYWFGEWATLLAILKKRSVIDHFITRAHGYDLYHERWPDGIIAFRSFQMHWVDRVFAVSRNGCAYLQRHYPEYSHKIHCSYLGVADIPISPEDNQSPMTILSCSGIIALKRVNLIAEALSHCKFPLKWIHIGDGPLKNDIEEKTQNLPRHIDVELKGYMSHDRIYEFYKTNRVDLFVHTSESEGLPVVMMEASMAGIPLMGCDVGGVMEIINEQTGILLPKEITPKEIASAIKSFKDSPKNSMEFRTGVKEYWMKHFNAEVNFNNFADELNVIFSD